MLSEEGNCRQETHKWVGIPNQGLEQMILRARGGESKPPQHSPSLFLPLPLSILGKPLSEMYQHECRIKGKWRLLPQYPFLLIIFNTVNKHFISHAVLHFIAMKQKLLRGLHIALPMTLNSYFSLLR